MDPRWKFPVGPFQLYIKKSFEAEQNELCCDGELGL